MKFNGVIKQQNINFWCQIFAAKLNWTAQNHTKAMHKQNIKKQSIMEKPA